MDYHIPVLLDACIQGLNIRKGGIYVDATFGGGGHSRAILEKMSGGKLLVFDQDEDSELEAGKLEDRRLTFIPANFRHIGRFLKIYNIVKVDGILADLGISSHQIDDGSRGFSTRFDGDLDMRMDRNAEKTAKMVINTYTESHLTSIFSRFGEIRNAKALARNIVSARISRPVHSTAELVEIAAKLAPFKKENKYLAQVFQALRIEVNDELTALEEFLIQTPELIRKGGRLAVIAYHSLEDRMVKNLINHGKISGEAEKDLFGKTDLPFKAVNKKPIFPPEAEIAGNSRARSAKLRIAEKN